MTEKTGQENVLSPERDHFFDSMRVPELPRIKKEVGSVFNHVPRSIS